MPSKTSSGQGDRYGRRGSGDNREKFSWSDLSTPEIGELVAAVLGIGDAVLFGVTRDGSAVRVILMSGDERESEYCGSADDLIAFAKSVSQHIADVHS